MATLLDLGRGGSGRGGSRSVAGSGAFLEGLHALDVQALAFRLDVLVGQLRHRERNVDVGSALVVALGEAVGKEVSTRPAYSPWW